MLKLIWFLISIFLIWSVFFHLPQEAVGLSSMTGQRNGSPRSSQNFFNLLIGLGIVIYFAIAVSFNLQNP